ncbi:MAG: hypothetical protein WA139_00800 [Candidatus Aenigmatarchaeota archaeon]
MGKENNDDEKVAYEFLIDSNYHRHENNGDEEKSIYEFLFF